MSRLRLLADDLTGALDSAAAFAPLPVLWSPDPALPAAALDSNTRDMAPDAVRAALPPFAADLAGAALAIKKLDSALRGHPALEIAACLAAGFGHAVIAPAFPAQGRISRAGRQLVGGIDTGIDLAADLAALGIPVRPCRSGDPAPTGVSLWDAASDAELAAVAAAGRALPNSVLWCGSAGLAAALAGPARPRLPRPPGPVLALIGTDHPTTRCQLDGCLVHLATDAALIAAALDCGRGIAVVPDLPAGLGRSEAAAAIAARFGALPRRLPRPGALFVTGGETLHSFCAALGVARLEVMGQLAPGVPVSTLVGGAWDGLPVVSKSGGFGGPALLADLLG